MIEFTEKQQVLSIFFGGRKGMDMLFVIHKPEPGQPWQLDYRFRYDGPDGKDERHWYQAKAKPGIPDEESASKMKEAVRVLMAVGQVAGIVDGLTELKVNGNGEDAIRMMSEQPWCHVTKENLQ